MILGPKLRMRRRRDVLGWAAAQKENPAPAVGGQQRGAHLVQPRDERSRTVRTTTTVPTDLTDRANATQKRRRASTHQRAS